MISETEMDDVLNIRILRLASKLSLIFQRETLRPVGIKVQEWRILISLAQFGELHLRALARHSSQDPAHTSRMLKSMIEKSWISKRPDKSDQRRTQFMLTDVGAELIADNWPKAKQFADDIAKLFSEEERQLFKDMLDRANVSCDERLADKRNP